MELSLNYSIFVYPTTIIGMNGMNMANKMWPKQASFL